MDCLVLESDLKWIFFSFFSDSTYFLQAHVSLRYKGKIVFPHSLLKYFFHLDSKRFFFL